MAKKRKYSKDLKPLQEVERGLSRAMKHAVEASIEGWKSWERARDKSAKKKKNGALRDAVANSIRAGATTARHGAVVGVDLFNAARPILPTRKQLVKALFSKK